MNLPLYLYEEITKKYLHRGSDLLDRGKPSSLESVEESHTPESIIIQEQEDQARAKAVYHGKRIMTSIERKIFIKLEQGLSELTIANQLHLTRQRVNKLKLKAVDKVQKLYLQWR